MPCQPECGRVVFANKLQKGGKDLQIAQQAGRDLQMVQQASTPGDRHREGSVWLLKAVCDMASGRQPVATVVVAAQ